MELSSARSDEKYWSPGGSIGDLLASASDFTKIRNLPAVTTLILFSDDLLPWTVYRARFVELRPSDRCLRLQTEEDVVYAAIDGKELTLNAFLPESTKKPVPAVVEIHGGWWHGGAPAGNVEGVGGAGCFKRMDRGIFISYRLGAEGGFPENIRYCRNAVRFIRKNATRFNIDPERILVTGGSAGILGRTPRSWIVPKPTKHGVHGRVVDRLGLRVQVKNALFTAWKRPPTFRRLGTCRNRSGNVLEQRSESNV